jgi:hypothetical protein
MFPLKNRRLVVPVAPTIQRTVRLFEENALLDNHDVQFGEPKVSRNISPPSSGSKSKLSKETAEGGDKQVGLSPNCQSFTTQKIEEPQIQSEFFVRT